MSLSNRCSIPWIRGLMNSPPKLMQLSEDACLPRPPYRRVLLGLAQSRVPESFLVIGTILPGFPSGVRRTPPPFHPLRRVAVPATATAFQVPSIVVGLVFLAPKRRMRHDRRWGLAIAGVSPVAQLRNVVPLRRRAAPAAARACCAASDRSLPLQALVTSLCDSFSYWFVSA